MIRPGRKILRGSRAPMVKGSRKVGAPSPGEIIEVDVYLRYHPKRKKIATMEELSAHLPHKRKHLSREEFAKNHGASQEDIEKVTDFAHQHHLDIVEVNPVHRLVTLKGTVKAMSAAFGVQLVHHCHPRSGVRFRTYEGLIEIPVELEDVVDGILGLEDLPVFSSYLAYDQAASISSGVDTGPGILYPNQLAQLYKFPRGLTGKGQTIAIIEGGGGFEPKYLQEYFDRLQRLFGIRPDVNNIIPVGVGGATNNPCSDPNDLANFVATMETYSDIEVAAAVAYEAKIVVYFTPDSYKGLVKALKQAILDTAHDISVISFSWGWPEPEKQSESLEPMMQIVNSTLHEAAVRGITFCGASGDSGSCDNLEPDDNLAHVDFPASSPWVLACGGTWLAIQNGAVQKEVTWKEHFDEFKVGNTSIKDVTFSTGGGVSEYFPCPDYQEKNGICPKSVNSPHLTGRGLPDIAGNADRRSGYIIQSGGEMANLGGTSMVAPLYAGLIALINQKLGTSVGFINPFLYKLGQSQNLENNPTGQKVFNDITEGDNSINNIPGYYAQKGWDACTGWGSVNGETLLDKLLNPDNHET